MSSGKTVSLCRDTMPRFALVARHTSPENAGVLSARKLLHLHHEQPDTLWTIEVKSGVWQTITAYRIIICQLTWTATRTNRSTYLFIQGASHPSYPEMQGPPGSASKRRVAADALASAYLAYTRRSVRLTCSLRAVRTHAATQPCCQRKGFGSLADATILRYVHVANRQKCQKRLLSRQAGIYCVHDTSVFHRPVHLSFLS